MAIRPIPFCDLHPDTELDLVDLVNKGHPDERLFACKRPDCTRYFSYYGGYFDIKSGDPATPYDFGRLDAKPSCNRHDLPRYMGLEPIDEDNPGGEKHYRCPECDDSLPYTGPPSAY
jgi:hypothetical protein